MPGSSGQVGSSGEVGRPGQPGEAGAAVSYFELLFESATCLTRTLS